MKDDPAYTEHGQGVPDDPEFPAVHEQLIVFARELGELYQLERRRSAELEQVLENFQETCIATMKSLALVIEAKDRGTRGHLDRTQAYGVALARRIDPVVAEAFIAIPIARLEQISRHFDLRSAEAPAASAQPLVGH